MTLHGKIIPVDLVIFPPQWKQPKRIWAPEWQVHTGCCTKHKEKAASFSANSRDILLLEGMAQLLWCHCARISSGFSHSNLVDSLNFVVNKNELKALVDSKNSSFCLGFLVYYWLFQFIGSFQTKQREENHYFLAYFKGPQAKKTGNHRAKRWRFHWLITFWLICSTYSKSKVKYNLEKSEDAGAMLDFASKSVQRLLEHPRCDFSSKFKGLAAFFAGGVNPVIVWDKTTLLRKFSISLNTSQHQQLKKITHPSLLKWLILHRNWDASTAWS